MQPQTQHSQVKRPQLSWGMIKQREGLSARPLTVEGATRKVNQGPAVPGKWWTVEYRKQYKGFTMTSTEAVMTGGRCIYAFQSIICPNNPWRSPEALWQVLQGMPWHADTTLQLAEVSSSQRSAHLDFCMFVLTHVCSSHSTVKWSTMCPELCTPMSMPSSACSVLRTGITDSVLVEWRIDLSSLPFTNRLCELTRRFFF